MISAENCHGNRSLKSNDRKPKKKSNESNEQSGREENDLPARFLTRVYKELFLRFSCQKMLVEKELECYDIRME